MAKGALRSAAIAGGESLLGKELRDLLGDRLPGVKAKLVGSEDESLILTEQAGEAVVMTGMDAESLAAADLVFLAGSQEGSRRAMTLLKESGNQAPVVDLSYALEELPEARLRAPLAAPDSQAGGGRIHVIAHPAASVLAGFFYRLREKHTIVRAIAHVLEPASELGRAGVDELHQQTIQLLSFKKPVKKVFDAQSAFNLLARYGEESPHKLQQAEQRIERHLATLLGPAGNIPMPSLRLVQAPVMHGHSFSVWVEMESAPDIEQMMESFTAPEYDVRGPDLDAPDIVGMAGQSGVAMGVGEADRNDRKAVWFWMVADNYRVMAENALKVGQELLSA
ncbi:MAG: hypothetical protein FJW20_17800 [Acidimicrobiia bacterium]|nr:hypothetical protein [Acidimicrobiia bacterium]